jgi:hypothetical protein
MIQQACCYAQKQKPLPVECSHRKGIGLPHVSCGKCPAEPEKQHHLAENLWRLEILRKQEKQNILPRRRQGESVIVERMGFLLIFSHLFANSLVFSSCPRITAKSVPQSLI